MIAQLDNFHELAAGAGAGDGQAVGGELLAVLIVELIAMAMAFLHLETAVGPVRFASFDEHRRIKSEAHGAAYLGDVILLVEQADDRVPAIAIHLGAIGIGQADDIAGELDDRALEAEADAKIRQLPLAGITDRFKLAFDAAVAEPARHEQ